MKKKYSLLKKSLAIIFGLIFIFSASWITMRILVKKNSQSLATMTAIKITSDIENMVTLPVAVSETMASDYSFHELIKKHNDEEFVKYLSSIQNNFGFSTAFFADDLTKIYHTYSGAQATVKKEKQSAAWYWKVRDGKDKYTVTVGINNQKGGVPAIYVNYKVYDDIGNFLGVCGVGYEVKDIHTLLAKYKNEYNLNVYFVNENRNILFGVDQNESNKTFKLGMKYLCQSEDFIYHENIKGGYVITKYLPVINNYLIIIQEEIQKPIHTILVMYFLISLAVAMIVLIIYVSIYLYRESKELNARAKIDKMTGLLNKSGFLEEAENLVKTQHSNIAFLFLDLDNFKSVNDNLGHAMGDKAIADAGKTIKASFRNSDVIGRFGGDEFVICVKNMGEELLTQRLGELVENLKSTYSNGNINIKVSTSIGAVYKETEESVDIEAMMEEADEALYRAKNSGKNRFELVK